MAKDFVFSYFLLTVPCKIHFCGGGAEELLALPRGSPSAGARVHFNPAMLCGSTVWL